ncbi:MAG: hypothetical protein IJX72_03635 [Clostridia bacterium]|nr:hypothetical protein [Clostridia bacterium]
MKANQSTKRAAAWSLSALVLSSVLLCSVACTRNDDKNPGDTTAGTSNGTPAVTTTATGNNGTGSNSDTPMNPDSGTVDPNGDAGYPPTGTDVGTEGRSFRSHFMH